MISCGSITEKEAAAVYIVGAQAPGYARSMGMKTRATFQNALDDAKKIVGDSLRIIALPKTFRLPGVHLILAEGD
jgi:lactate racemase